MINRRVSKETMQTGLVSLITPCYNTGDIIHRLMDSVLSQDYPRIEMFVVDDGATDNTRDVISSYVKRFAERGYVLNYVYQSNAGQAAAVNRVLSLVTGEFLAWPDSDDYYASSRSISTFVHQFDKLDESYGLVRSYPIYIDEKTLKPIQDNRPRSYDEQQFENCLFSKSGFVWPPVNYMARMTCFRRVNPSMSIYTGFHFAQNWQMLLPLLYSYKCYTIEESLSCVLVRTESYSRGAYNTYEQRLHYIQSHMEIRFYTLDRISEISQEERDVYKQEVRKQNIRDRLDLAMQYGQHDDVMECLKSLKDAKVKVGFKEKIKVWLLRYPVLYKVLLRLNGFVR